MILLESVPAHHHPGIPPAARRRWQLLSEDWLLSSRAKRCGAAENVRLFSSHSRRTALHEAGGRSARIEYP